jgi:protease I
MAGKLDGMGVAFLATDMFEQVELTEPWNALEQAGANIELVSLEPGEIQGFNHYDRADTFRVDRTVADARADDYDALVLPGGVGNPDQLRMNEDAVRFVRDFFDAGKPIGSICHGPWVLVEAGIVEGRTVVPELEDRHPERRRKLGRQGRLRGRGNRHEPQTGRPAGVQREADRGVRRGRARPRARRSWCETIGFLEPFN